MQWLLGQRLWSALSSWVERLLGLDPRLLANVLDTLLAVLVWMAVQRLVTRALRRRVEDPTRRYTISKTLRYVLGVVLLLVVAKIWLQGRVSLSTYLGILSAGLAVALQDPIANLAGWIFIHWRQPFRIGDRIQIGAHVGDVVDLRLFVFTVVEVGNWVDGDQSTGRIIHIPNGRVFKEPVANYTQGFEYIWHEIPVSITFESDWERAQAILTRILDENAEKLDETVVQQVEESASQFNVMFKHLTPIVWTKVGPNGVVLTLRFLCHARRRRSTESAVWQAILRAFAAEPDIRFAYSTRRVVDLAREQKPAEQVEVDAPSAAQGTAGG